MSENNLKELELNELIEYLNNTNINNKRDINHSQVIMKFFNTIISM